MDEIYNNNPHISNLDLQIEEYERIVSEYKFLTDMLSEISKFKTIEHKRDVNEHIADFRNRVHNTEQSISHLKLKREELIEELSRTINKRIRYYYIPYIVLIVWIAVFLVFIFYKQDVIFGSVLSLIGILFVLLFVLPQGIHYKIEYVFVGLAIMVPLLSFLLNSVFGFNLVQMVGASLAQFSMGSFNFLINVRKIHHKSTR